MAMVKLSLASSWQYARVVSFKDFRTTDAAEAVCCGDNQQNWLGNGSQHKTGTSPADASAGSDVSVIGSAGSSSACGSVTSLPRVLWFRYFRELSESRTKLFIQFIQRVVLGKF